MKKSIETLENIDKKLRNLFISKRDKCSLEI